MTAKEFIHVWGGEFSNLNRAGLVQLDPSQTELNPIMEAQAGTEPN